MSNEISRRTLVQGIAASSVVSLAGCNAPATGSGEDTLSESEDTGTGDEPAFRLEEYPRMRIGSLDDIGEEPLTFQYPLESQTNFVVKLGEEANGGVGPDNDIVAFTYACSHMGCSLEGTYKKDHSMLGACSCHLSRFDLTNYGMVVDGVATQSLPMITLDIDENDDVYATGVMGLLYGYRDNLKDEQPSQSVKKSMGTSDATQATEAPMASSSSTQSGGVDAPFDGYLDDVSNYDETITDATGQDRVTVTVGADGNSGNFAFDPAAVHITPGTTVVWEWNGKGGQHNVVDENGTEFESALTAESGFTFEHTFEEEATITYFCQPHKSLGMKGGIVVGNAPAENGADATVSESSGNTKDLFAVGSGLGLVGALLGLFAHGFRENSSQE